MTCWNKKLSESDLYGKKQTYELHRPPRVRRKENVTFWNEKRLKK